MVKRLAPPVAALIGALLLWRRGHQTLATAVALGAVVLFLLAVFAPGVLERFDALLRRVIHAAFNAFTGLLGVLVVTPLWALLKAVRVDPLRPRARTADRWHRAAPALAHDTYSAVPAARGSERWRVRGALIVVVGLSVGAFLLVTSGGESTEQVREEASANAIPYQPFAYADEPDGQAIIADYWRTNVSGNAETIWQNADYHGPYHNIENGVRRSWTPEDPTLTVWVVGGSAAWGLGQRDERTIPSMLARKADAEGIELDVRNMAVPGFVSWQETALLRRELARQEPPDLIIVYDGSNDLGTVMHRASDGIVPLDRPGNLMDVYAPGFAPPPTGPEIRDLDAIADGALTIVKEEHRAMASAAEAAGVPIVFAWQPSIWSGGPNRWDSKVIEASGLYPPYVDQVHQVEDQVVAGLPGTVDLRTALDDASGPTFFDTVHTNEAGAAIVGDALWEQIAPQVRELAASDGASGS